jgi:hypothetical protein
MQMVTTILHAQERLETKLDNHIGSQELHPSSHVSPQSIKEIHHV